MSNLIDLVKDLATPCAECGEVGRPKAVMGLEPYCHDEEKSCYNFRLFALSRRIG